jgi:hypothetical protein
VAALADCLRSDGPREKKWHPASQNFLRHSGLYLFLIVGLAVLIWFSFLSPPLEVSSYANAWFRALIFSSGHHWRHRIFLPHSFSFRSKPLFGPVP